MEKEEVIKEANNLLERTKNNIERYEEERKILFNYIEKTEKIDYKLLENYLNLFEQYLNLQEYFAKNDELKSILKELANQQNRKYENDDRLKIFKILDNENKEYLFLSRKSMNEFMQANREKFDFDTPIELIDNTNIDLEIILDLLEKIF